MTASLAACPLFSASSAPTVGDVALFLTAISAYWVAAAVALLIFSVRRRPGMVNALITSAIVWLILRALGAILRLLIPCIAPNAESSFGFVVAVTLSYLLPLRLWQRLVPLSIVVLMAVTRSLALGCQVPGELALAAGILFFGGLVLWWASRWQPVRDRLQRTSLAIDNWGTGRARTPLTPVVQAVLAARLRRHLGFAVERIEPLGAQGVHASTPLILSGQTQEGEPQQYFAKVVSLQNWQTSVIFEALRWVRFHGRLRGGPIWPTLQSLVEFEHYMMLLFQDLGVPAPRPYGVYRLERYTYALVSEYLEGAQSLREAGDVPEVYVRRAFGALRRMRQGDVAHRDIKSSNLVLLPGDGFAFVDLALAHYVAGPRRLARDLADMLVVLSMRHEPERVVAIAAEVIGPGGLRRSRAYLKQTLINDEMQKLVPPDLLPLLRRLVARQLRTHR